MGWRPSQKLTADHAELDQVLTQLQTSLDRGDLAASHANLDLFWARLAVHIRAEHLHLFPEVMVRVSEKAGEDASVSVSEAGLAVEQLRADHEFFMHELAAAIAGLRDLTEGDDVQVRLKEVSKRIAEVQKRLITHNQSEENRIYRWANDLFDEREQIELAARVNSELRNRPPRFAADRWSNEFQEKN